MKKAAAETILVVYDSRAIRETVTVLAFAEDYHVVELDDPSLLLKTFEEVDPDLVLLCAMARRTTAFDNCKHIKEMTSGTFVPVLIYTLKAGSAERERAFEAGADDTIQVTIAPEDLLYRIRSLLRLRGVVREWRERTQNIARASVEAGDIILQLEEAERRIRGQNEELEQMVQDLEERDDRIVAQQAEIKKHLETLERDVELAAQLQISMLPSDYPESGDLLLFDRYIPATELGGDYYDFLNLGDGRFYLNIADVTGHGVAPALVSVQVRTTARSAMQAGKPPAQILRELNQFMGESFGHDFLMTMICLFYEPQTHAVTFSGAGHCPLVHLAAEGQNARQFCSRGLPLGVAAETEFVADTLALAPGDRLLLYTDGITEAAAKDGCQFGVRNLITALVEAEKRNGRDTIDALLQAARGHTQAATFDDDVTLVLLERRQA